MDELQQQVFNVVGDVPPAILVIGAVAAALLVGATFARARNALILIGTMLLFASIGEADFEEHILRPQFLVPIQAIRSELFALVGLLLGIGLTAHVGLHAHRRLAPQSILLLAIAFYAAMLRIVHEGPVSGAVSVVLALVTIVPMMLILPRILDDWDDLVGIVRFIILVGVAWLGLVVIQAAIDPGAMVVGRQGRFFGPTGNPQQAAIILGMNTAFLVWLFNHDRVRSLRLVYAVLAGLSAVGVLWTGSRTGLALMVIGVTVVAYARVGRTILYLPLGLLGLYAGWTLLNTLGVDLAAASRVTSLQDTRTERWLAMFEVGRSSPWLGVGVEQAGGSENSYLYAFASYGIGMVLLVLLLLLLSLSICLRLLRLRRFVDERRRPIIDIVLAYNAMYFIGGFVEGYILARVSFNLVLLLLFAAMARRIEELVAEEWAETAAAPAADELEEPDPGAVDPWGFPLAMSRGGGMPGRT